MSQKRISLKLRLAAEVLTQEHLADDSPEFIIDLVRKKGLGAGRVYAACEHFGYRWVPRQQRWVLQWPVWLAHQCKLRNEEIMKGWR